MIIPATAPRNAPPVKHHGFVPNRRSSHHPTATPSNTVATSSVPMPMNRSAGGGWDRRARYSIRPVNEAGDVPGAGSGISGVNEFAVLVNPRGRNTLSSNSFGMSSPVAFSNALPRST